MAQGRGSNIHLSSYLFNIIFYIDFKNRDFKYDLNWKKKIKDNKIKYLGCIEKFKEGTMFPIVGAGNIDGPI